jgi:acetoacetyl-CoA synthetase
VGANIERFLAGFSGYAELHRWSLEEPEEFWAAVWRFCGVRCSRRWDEVLDRSGTRWFAGAELNFAAAVLRPQDDVPALHDRARNRKWTHRELYLDVARLVKALEAAGVGERSRVAACLPAIPEAVIALLATAALGAIWVPWAEGITAAAPAVLFGTDGPSAGRLRQLAAEAPGLRQAVVVALDQRSPDLAGLPRALRWQDFTLLHAGCHDIRFRLLPFGQPLVLAAANNGLRAYSGGGLLVQFLKEMVLHLDVKATSRVAVSREADPATLLRAVAALGAGATLEFGAEACEAGAALPATAMLPNPLAPDAGAVPALGLHIAGGRILAPCPSLPVDWH